MFVRFLGSIPTVAMGEIEMPIQSCGATVGGATAVTELVVVKALRIFSSLCEAEEPPYVSGV